MKKSQMPPTKNECLLQFDPLFERLEQIFANNPPKKGDERFNDPVFKRFHDELTSKFENIMNETILSPKNIPENIIIEFFHEWFYFLNGKFLALRLFDGILNNPYLTA